eukprot:GFYU01034442.1.p1 GENE.GFYU01034442.1~~GFYU01034442.1.p1  ORF type:complete len:231 (-),score=23.30 GFYU01034442.1:40-732(-)
MSRPGMHGHPYTVSYVPTTAYTPVATPSIVIPTRPVIQQPQPQIQYVPVQVPTPVPVPVQVPQPVPVQVAQPTHMAPIQQQTCCSPCAGMQYHHSHGHHNAPYQYHRKSISDVRQSLNNLTKTDHLFSADQTLLPDATRYASAVDAMRATLALLNTSYLYTSPSNLGLQQLTQQLIHTLHNQRTLTSTLDANTIHALNTTMAGLSQQYPPYYTNPTHALLMNHLHAILRR